MTGPLPRFLVIGAMKAGTTSLHHYLDAHPDLFLPRTKELNFFRDARTHARGEAWYRAQFADALPHQVPGEVSPDYTKHPHHSGAPQRIAAMLPDVRLVYVLRDPLQRMLSMHLHQVAAGRETRSAADALLADEHYLEVSRYGMQVERYLEHFSREQLLLVSAEALLADRGAVAARIHEFVGVEPRPETAEGVSEEYYRGSDRRQRGALARGAVALRPLREGFSRLPAPVQSAVRRVATRPMPAVDRGLPPEVEHELRARLATDVAVVRRLAPDVVARWEGWTSA